MNTIEAANESELIDYWIKKACWDNGMSDLKINYTFNKRMTKCLGQAIYKHKTIELSVPLWPRMSDKRHVVIHEACHIIAFAKHGTRIKGHGIEWKQCMLNAGVAPERTYDIDRTGLVRQYKKYSAACACVSVWVSGVRAAKIKKGELACGKCKATLVLTGYVYPDDDATIAKSA